MYVPVMDPLAISLYERCLISSVMIKLFISRDSPGIFVLIRPPASSPVKLACL